MQLASEQCAVQWSRASECIEPSFPRLMTRSKVEAAHRIALIARGTDSIARAWLLYLLKNGVHSADLSSIELRSSLDFLIIDGWQLNGDGAKRNGNGTLADSVTSKAEQCTYLFGAPYVDDGAQQC